MIHNKTRFILHPVQSIMFNIGLLRSRRFSISLLSPRPRHLRFRLFSPQPRVRENEMLPEASRITIVSEKSPEKPSEKAKRIEANVEWKRDEEKKSERIGIAY